MQNEEKVLLMLVKNIESIENYLINSRCNTDSLVFKHTSLQFNPVKYRRTVLQSAEGQIARQLLLNGVEAGIPALPIHHAFAVEEQHVIG